MWHRLMYNTGVLSDATKSVSRAYINNFQDKGKQAAIDIFLVRDALIPIEEPYLTVYV